MSRNGPKWLVAICKLETVAGCGSTAGAITPALLTSTWIGPSAAAFVAAVRTEAELGEIELEALDARTRHLLADEVGSTADLRRVAPGEDDAGTAPGELEGDVVAETVGTGR